MSRFDRNEPFVHLLTETCARCNFTTQYPADEPWRASCFNCGLDLQAKEWACGLCLDRTFVVLQPSACETCGTVYEKGPTLMNLRKARDRVRRTRGDWTPEFQRIDQMVEEAEFNASKDL